MNRFLWIVCSVLFVVLVALPCRLSAANITETGAAIGHSCTVSGNYSTATGNHNVANGDYTTAMGENTWADGDASTAMGYWTFTQGPAATAMGYWTQASDYGTAIGYYAFASANYSTIVGMGHPYSTVFNDVSHSFMVGYLGDSDSAPDFFVKDGGVGINTTTPLTSLHVRKSISGGASMANHVAAIENTSGYSMPNVLALKVNIENPTTDCNFITFEDSAGILGSISGNGSGGIQLNTSGGDFAEHIPKTDLSEMLHPGDIVGLFPDGLSKRTQNALRVMVVTTAPAILGHHMDTNDTSTAGVAFLGQVPIRVEGQVSAGDYIVASCHSDGIGIAVPSSEIRSTHYARIAGRALVSDSRKGIKSVTSLVGLPHHILRQDVIRAKNARIKAFEKRLTVLESESQKSVASGLLPGLGIVAGGLGLVCVGQKRRHL